MDKRTAIAFGLIILVIILLPTYYKMIMPPQQTVPNDSLRVESTKVSGSGAVSPVTQPQKETPEEIARETLPPAAEEQSADLAGFSTESSPLYAYVRTPLYELTFSTRGGVLVGARLLQYAGRDEGKVQLVRPGSDDNLSVTLYRTGSILNTKDIRFQPNMKSLEVGEDESRTLTLRAEGENGAWIEKQFTFNGDRYPFEMRLRAGGIPDLDDFYEVIWGSGLEITETDTAQDLYYAKAYAYMGGELETFKGKGDRDLTGQASGKTEWVALRNKYFEVAIVPQSDVGKGVGFAIQGQPKSGKYQPKVYSITLRMGGMLSREPGVFTVYCGPIDQDLLAEVHPQLTETMNWGWAVIEPFSKLILWALKGLHSFIPNYGLVLIIFSVLVKVVVWPLTHKSTRSMSRMSALQPKIKELQEKYKGQPEKLNKATMQLYKEEGVNPLSSCWPMLLQMPLLYALFIIFRSTIELRGAPFILWIQDLSMPDTILQLPFNVPIYGNHVALLPIFMGVTQIMMSGMMMTDPKQKATKYMMPVFMIMIFNNFPSGLTLYYALFNLWTYLQQKWLKRQGVLPTPQPSRS
jgi:YidC/Oxa1 family membrane protein insertase